MLPEPRPPWRFLHADDRRRTRIGLHTDKNWDMTPPSVTIYTDRQLSLED
jgi:hypothetical protein